MCPWCKLQFCHRERYKKWKLRSAEDTESDKCWTCLLSSYHPFEMKEGKRKSNSIANFIQLGGAERKWRCDGTLGESKSGMYKLTTVLEEKHGHSWAGFILKKQTEDRYVKLKYNID